MNSFKNRTKIIYGASLIVSIFTTIILGEIIVSRPNYLIENQNMPSTMTVSFSGSIDRTPQTYVNISSNPLAIFNTKELLVSFGGGYSYLNIPLELQTNLNDGRYHSAFVSVFGTGKLANDRFSWLSFAGYGIASSDLSKNFAESDKASILGMISFKLLADLSLGITAICILDQSDFNLVPLPYVAWCKKQHFLEIGPSPELKAGYRFNPNLSFSGGLGVMGDSYYIIDLKKIFDYQNTYTFLGASFRGFRFFLFDLLFKYPLIQDGSFRDSEIKIGFKKNSPELHLGVRLVIE